MGFALQEWEEYHLLCKKEYTYKEMDRSAWDDEEAFSEMHVALANLGFSTTGSGPCCAHPYVEDFRVTGCGSELRECSLAAPANFRAR